MTRMFRLNKDFFGPDKGIVFPAGSVWEDMGPSTFITGYIRVYNPTYGRDGFPQENLEEIILTIGDRVFHTETGQECEVVDYYPQPDDRYLIRHPGTGGALNHFNTVARVDIWNYYSMWPGTQEEMPNKEEKKPRHCEHKLVNVSFMGINMRCKYCDMDEDQVRADMERRRNDYTDPTGY